MCAICSSSRRWGALSCVAVLLFCGVANETVAAAPPHAWSDVELADLSYVHAGRTIRLTPVMDRVVVSFRNDTEEADWPALISRHPSAFSDADYTALPKNGLCSFGLSEEAGSWAELREILHSVALDPSVSFVAPLLTDGAQRVMLKDEVVIRFADSVSVSESATFLAGTGMTQVARLPGDESTVLAQVQPDRVAELLTSCRDLARQDVVDFCHPNFVRFVSTFDTPNDPHFGEQWALDNTGQSGGTPDADIDAPEAWDIAKGNGTVTIAVIDTGVDLDHEDLDDRIVTGFDAVDNDEVPAPNPWDYHGTACAGIAAAEGDNSTGVSGVTWNSNIMPIRIFYSESAADTVVIAEDWWIGLGIQTAWLRGADVLSNSWSWGEIPSDVIENTIRAAKTYGRDGLGCVIVFAAGNRKGAPPDSVKYPARMSEVIAVSATNQWDEFKDLESQDGEFWSSCHGSEVDVSGPGVSCWTTDVTGEEGASTGDYYSSFNGTSCAAPHVAGLAALVLTLAPAMTSDEVQAVIEASADDLEPPGFDIDYGHGRINAHATLLAVEELLPVQYVNGTISGEETWTPDKVYVIESGLTLSETGVLHIQAGTIVKLKAQRSFDVHGVLDLQGVAGNEVVFTSWYDDDEGGDTNGDGPSSGDDGTHWSNVRIYSPNTISYCRLKYGGYGGFYGNPMLHVIEPLPAVTVSHCTFSHWRDAPVPRAGLVYEAEPSQHTSPVISDNTFVESGSMSCAIDVNGAGENTSAHIMGNTLMNSYIDCNAISTVSTVTDNMIVAGRLHFSDCSPRVLNNTIQDYDGYPIAVRGTSFPYYAGNTIHNTTYKAVDVAGTIAGNGTWEPVETGDLPLVYWITSNTVINEGATLSVPAGTVVKFSGGRTLIAHGILDAQGIEGNEVVFTSSKDDSMGGDSNGDAAATYPSAGDWRYVQINNANNSLEHCRIRYGGSSYGALLVDQSQFSSAARGSDGERTSDHVVESGVGRSLPTAPTISACAFTDCSTGLYVIGAAGSGVVTVADNSFDGSPIRFDDCSPLVSGNTIENCPTYPVQQLNGSFPTYVGNTIQNNGFHAIGVTGSITSDGTWGEVAGEWGPLVYQMWGNLYVEEGATLTIPAGTVVKAVWDAAMHVNGVLNTEGTEGNEVVFTSHRDDHEGGDTNGDEGTTVGSPGDWRYIRVTNGENTFGHCRFKFAGQSSLRALWLDHPSPAVNVHACSFTDCNGNAILYEADGSVPTFPVISGNSMTGGEHGIKISGDLAFTEAAITSNTLTACSIKCTGIAPESILSGNTLTGGGLVFTDCSPVVSGNVIQDFADYPLTQQGTSFPQYDGNTFEDNAPHAIRVYGTITDSGVWTHVPGEDYPLVYQVHGHLTVQNGATLAIPTGTVVKVYDDNWIKINGALDAQGVAGNEVVFTSWRDDWEWGDSNRDGDTTVAARNDWDYIMLTSGTSGVDHWRVKYAGQSGYSLRVYRPDPAIPITNCTFQTCNGEAIRYEAHDSAVTSPLISHNTISDADHGIRVTGTATGTVATVSSNTLTCGGGSHTGLILEDLAEGTTVAWNVIENFYRGIYCSDVTGTITCNALAQTGGSVGTGTGAYIVDESDLLINANTLQGFAVGLHSESGNANPPSTLNVSMNRIVDNGDKGVYLRSISVGQYTGPSILLNDNDIHGNGGYDLFLGPYQDPSTTEINAENNWWGTIDPASIAAGIYDHADDPSSPIADFTPYRDGPVDFAEPDILLGFGHISFEVFPGDGQLDTLAITNTGALALLEFSIEEAVGERTMGEATLDGSPQRSDGASGSRAVDIPWLSVAPMSGVILPGETMDVLISCSSVGLDPGEYVAYLIISSNDPDESPAVVAVSLDVSPVFLLAPDGGETLECDQVCNVTWTTDDPGDVDSVDLYYSTDDGATFDLVEEGLQEVITYDWRVPWTPSDMCRFKVVANYVGGASFEDTSDGRFMIVWPTSVVSDETAPQDVGLGLSITPNPFRGETTLRFSLARDADVRITVYDVAGRLVAVPLASRLLAGNHIIPWGQGCGSDGGEIASGVYFCRVEVGSQSVVRKMVVLR